MAFTPLAAGTVLSKRYKIIDLIRRGGMGATYRAEDMELHKAVAAKQLPDDFRSEEDRESGIGDFLAEMALLKSIEHPRIPAILDHFVNEHGFFFIQEFVEGSDFTRLLEDTGRAGLPENEVIHTGIRICRILGYLHGRKPEPIIHRDIKSSNIMKRSRDREIFLLDFGIARAFTRKKNMMVGTPGYAPPEQYANRTDIRSDIYSLGATLHELATGLRPDPVGFAFPPPHAMRPRLSPDFSQVILTATRYSPGERYQEAFMLEEALQNLLPAPLPTSKKNPSREFLTSFQREILLPELRELIKRHPNECHSDSLPPSITHFTLTLGIQISHSLMIDVDQERHCITFHIKEGMLPAVFLGEIFPSDADARVQLSEFLNRYEAACEGRL